MLSLYLQMISFDVISLPLWHQFPRRVFLESVDLVWSLSHSTKQRQKCDACRGQDSLSGAGSEETQNYVANCFSCYEVGGTQWVASVGQKVFDWAENIKSVKPSSLQRKHLSPQLTRLVRSHKDLQGIYWMICNEFDARNCRENRKKSRWSFF